MKQQNSKFSYNILKVFKNVKIPPTPKQKELIYVDLAISVIAPPSGIIKKTTTKNPKILQENSRWPTKSNHFQGLEMLILSVHHPMLYNSCQNHPKP